MISRSDLFCFLVLNQTSTMLRRPNSQCSANADVGWIPSFFKRKRDITWRAPESERTWAAHVRQKGWLSCGFSSCNSAGVSGQGFGKTKMTWMWRFTSPRFLHVNTESTISGRPLSWESWVESYYSFFQGWCSELCSQKAAFSCACKCAWSRHIKVV